MKILVLNGSPKGENSVTMSYVKYLETVYPHHSFAYRHIAQSINKIEKDGADFDEIIEDVRGCDTVLWAFPLYYLLVHSNYKRFIELIFERNSQDAFKGKYTASFSTSIHFFDHTAHNYIQGICDDMEMNYVSSFSADMNDLMDKNKRRNLCIFAEELFWAVETKAKTTRSFAKLNHSMIEYKSENAYDKIDLNGSKLIIFAESTNLNCNLGKMILRFKESFKNDVEIVDLSKIKIAGGCLGCVKCGFDNECVYDGKDDVREVYEEKLKKADVIVFAGSMKDRFLSARFKSFINRRFYKTHQPAYPGKQIGYIISGPLSQEQNLRQILQAYVEIDQANLVDIVTDEGNSSLEIDERLSSFAKKLVYYGQKHYMKPRTFLGIGGAKIFRDEIWGSLRFMFHADYKYYKKHGMIDFPQRSIIIRLVHLLIPIMRIKPIKREIQSKTKNMMHFAHDKVIEAEKRKLAKHDNSKNL